MSPHSALYSSLPVDSKSIRILKIFPEEDSFAKLRCELKVIPLLDTFGLAAIETHFDALSYTWGEASFLCTVICNGTEIKITAALFEALSYLRTRQDEMLIWIDAICINQGDTTEKSIQVQLMKHIYTNAKVVRIWLGRDDGSTEQALKLIQAARDHYRQELAVESVDSKSQICLKTVLAQKNFPYDIAPEEFSDALSIGRGFPSTEARKSWEPLVMLLSRKWFSRCWIKQESALASVAVVQVGGHRISWLDLHHAMHFFVTKGYVSADISGFALVLQNVFSLGGWSRAATGLPWTPKSLITLLESTRTLEATVKLDKVYSLLGLVEEAAQIPVDYSMSVVELYVLVTRILLQPPSTSYTYPLQVLANVNLYSRMRADGKELIIGEPFPSWVVQWDAAFRNTAIENEKEHWGSTLIPSHMSGGPPKFCAGGNYYTGAIYDPVVPYEISLHGFTFAKISTSVSICRLPPLSRPRLWDLVLEIWSLSKGRDKLYPTGESIDEAFAQTLTIADPNPASSTAIGSTEPYHAIDFRSFCCAMYEKTISTFIEEHRIAEIEPFEKKWKGDYLRLKNLVGTHTSPSFSANLQRTCMGRTIFATWTGYIGIGDNTLEPGDLVCVLLGGRTPYILRPAGEHKYKFVGECYLHGIMHGESLSERLAEESLLTLV